MNVDHHPEGESGHAAYEQEDNYQRYDADPHRNYVHAQGDRERSDGRYEGDQIRNKSNYRTAYRYTTNSSHRKSKSCKSSASSSHCGSASGEKCSKHDYLERKCCGGPRILDHLPPCAVPTSYSDYLETSRSYGCSERCFPRIAKPDDFCNGFRANITPMTGLTASNSDNGPLIQFVMRRRNHVVTMQWEPFEGSISQAGVGYLSVQQSFSNMPSYPVDIPYRLILRSTSKMAFIRIDPSASIQVKFYLDISGSGGDINMGDSVIIPSSSVNWITEC